MDKNDSIEAIKQYLGPKVCVAVTGAHVGPAELLAHFAMTEEKYKEAAAAKGRPLDFAEADGRALTWDKRELLALRAAIAELTGERPTEAA